MKNFLQEIMKRLRVTSISLSSLNNTCERMLKVIIGEKFNLTQILSNEDKKKFHEMTRLPESVVRRFF